MAEVGIRTFNSLNTETSAVRDVSKFLPTLDKERTALMTLTMKTKRKVTVKNPRIEFFDQADITMITPISAAAIASNVTAIPVVDITLFAPNDIWMTSRAAGTDSTLEELLLVTAVAGTTNGTLTVTRAFAGSTADTIGTSTLLKFVAVAGTETSAAQTPRTPLRVPHISGCQMFEDPCQTSRTSENTEVYDVQKERQRQQYFAMRHTKQQLENAALFGRYSESLNGSATRYTTMGLRSIIASNVVDMGGTMTYQTFLAFSTKSFEHNGSGGADKLLIAAPKFKEALDFLAANKQQTRTTDNKFGISLTTFVTSVGTWRLANNYNLNGGLADEALGVDLTGIEYCPLQGFDTKMYADYDPQNPKVIKDLILTQAGFRIYQESWHSRAYDVISY